MGLNNVIKQKANHEKLSLEETSDAVEESERTTESAHSVRVNDLVLPLPTLLVGLVLVADVLLLYIALQV